MSEKNNNTGENTELNERRRRGMKDVLIDVLNGDPQEMYSEEEAEQIRKEYFEGEGKV